MGERLFPIGRLDKDSSGPLLLLPLGRQPRERTCEPSLPPSSRPHPAHVRRRPHKHAAAGGRAEAERVHRDDACARHRRRHRPARRRRGPHTTLAQSDVPTAALHSLRLRAGHHDARPVRRARQAAHRTDAALRGGAGCLARPAGARPRPPVRGKGDRPRPAETSRDQPRVGAAAVRARGGSEPADPAHVRCLRARRDQAAPRGLRGHHARQLRQAGRVGLPHRRRARRDHAWWRGGSERAAAAAAGAAGPAATAAAAATGEGLASPRRSTSTCDSESRLAGVCGVPPSPEILCRDFSSSVFDRSRIFVVCCVEFYSPFARSKS